MKLEEAIKILSDEVLESIPSGQIAHMDAIRLAIEALERLKELHHIGAMSSGLLLPGETLGKPLHSLGFNTGDDESP